MALSPDYRWDLSFDNPNGQLTLVVEVKNKTNVSPEWVAKLRRNMLVHGTLPKAPYFLIVFPDQIYLWIDENYLEWSEPAYIVDARSIFQPYFEQAGVTASQISEQSLELIVAAWLEEIIYLPKPPKNIDDSQCWLVDSGLYAALTGGKCEHEAVA